VRVEPTQAFGDRTPIPLADILQALRQLDVDGDDPPPGALSSAIPKGSDSFGLAA
jgi:hypothetical protein